MLLVGVVLAAVVAAATSVHLPVSTTNPAAQAAVDRGLFLYYAYNRDDAARSFSRAAALDPHLAMAYWGVALANGPDLNTPTAAERFRTAARAIAQAQKLDAQSTPRERGFIEIMALRYRGSFGDWSRNEPAYHDAMLQFARKSGGENAELLAAEALLEDGGLAWKDGSPASPYSRDALGLVTDVLKLDPANPMANHVCVHLYDLAPDRTPALRCAQRLDAAAFSAQAEHLAHMPAHYWIETGDYAAALKSSERAYADLMQMLAERPDSPHANRYNQHVVAVGYSASMMLGNYAVALRWAQRMQSVYDASFEALTALRFGRYAAAYAAQGNQYGGQSVRGLAAIRLGKLKEAHAIAARLPAAAKSQGYLGQLFLARLAEADGKLQDAREWVERARTSQRNDFSGELIPLFPADELLGALALQRGDDRGAVAAFTDVLAAYPNDPRALYGLATALEAGAERAQAAAARTRFSREWKGADTSVTGALP